MTGKSPLTASEAQRAGLMVLAGSRDSRRWRADRARAVTADAGWLDQRADRRGVWRARGRGSGCGGATSDDAEEELSEAVEGHRGRARRR